MSDLAEFLLASIAKDEEAAQAAVASPWEAVTDDHGRGRSREHSVWSGDMHGSYVAEWIAARVDAAHIARWDPARVLAECDAKRRIVVRCQEMLTAAVPMAVHLAQQTLADLGRPLADHPDYPDYREEWKP